MRCSYTQNVKNETKIKQKSECTPPNSKLDIVLNVSCNVLSKAKQIVVTRNCKD